MRNQFERVLNEVNYKIFARLDAKGLALSRVVCREWNRMLSHTTVQTLSLNSKTAKSSVFLLNVYYQPNKDDIEVVKWKEMFLIMNDNGMCRSLDKWNTANLNLHRVWNVSCNGILVSFPKHGDDKIVVYHPSLRWIKEILFTHTWSLLAHNHVLRGAHYNQSTSHFTLLFGFPVLRQGICCYNIHLYTSKTRKWNSIVKESGCENFFELENPNSVFSQECFFWLDQSRTTKPDKRLVIFNLSMEMFYAMPLPICPLPHLRGINVSHLEHRGWELTSWKLRGCDGRLVLVHFCKEDKIVGWRLEQNVIAWEWCFLFCMPQLSKCAPKSLFDTNKNGLWLWSKIPEWGMDDHNDLLMLGDGGDVQHSIPMSNLVAFLGTANGSHPFVNGVWTLETNSLWDMLAFS